MTTVQLYQGDCLEVMKQIADGSVDMILCDLPYGTTDCRWDAIVPLEPLWEQYARVARPNAAIVLTAAQPFSSALVMSRPHWFRHEWMWDKRMVTGIGNVSRAPLRQHEVVLVFGQKTPNYYPACDPATTVKCFSEKPRHSASPLVGAVKTEYSARNVGYPRSILSIPRPNNLTDGGYHPTQKPVALGEYLVKTYTNPAETVMDNCMGSGSFGVACVNTDRNFIGIELDPGYFAIAEKRIAEAQAEKATELLSVS